MPPERPEGAGAFPKPVERAVPLSPDPAALYAALDLGTNSCRMLIAQPKGNQFHVVDSFSKSVQLGTGLETSGRLSRGSMQRTVQALRICQSKLKKHEVRRMRLVATEACRRASNAAQFIGYVERETGLELEIIEPEEEGVILRFGEFNRTVEPGLHFKLPAPIDTLQRIDVRTHVLDPAPSEFLTLEQRNLEIDAFVAWRVRDPRVFLTSLRDRGGERRRAGVSYNDRRGAP